MKQLILASLISLAAFTTRAEPAHNYSDILSGLKLNNTCLTAETVESIQPVQVCTNLVPITHNPGTENEYINWECHGYALQKLVNPRTISRVVCAKSENSSGETGLTPKCLKYKTSLITLPETISTMESISTGESSQNIYRDFTFPKCNAQN